MWIAFRKLNLKLLKIKDHYENCINEIHLIAQVSFPWYEVGENIDYQGQKKSDRCMFYFSFTNSIHWWGSWDALTSHERRRHRWFQKRPWPTPTSACDTPRDPAPAGWAWKTINMSTSLQRLYKADIRYIHVHMYSMLAWLPWGIGGSNEEIDHHPVTHVKTMLHRPKEKPNSIMITDAVYTVHIASVCIRSQTASLGTDISVLVRIYETLFKKVKELNP